MTLKADVAVIGAGAAGMMCAAQAGRRGRSVVVVDHKETPGEKIRISGGGRCNFTNLHTRPENFLSENPHFCKSALSRYTQHDFIKLVDRHGIAWHEKTLGQLFCDNSAHDIIDMLCTEMSDARARLMLGVAVTALPRKEGDVFVLDTSAGRIEASSLVVACGGLSIPKIGATGFGYDIARHYGHGIIPTRAALVPLVFGAETLAKTKPLAGISVPQSDVSCNGTSFREGLLLTHKGLSGPSILQISSYWREGDTVTVDLAPDRDVYAELRAQRSTQPRQHLRNALRLFVPERLADFIANETGHDQPLADLSDKKLQAAAQNVAEWRFIPTGSEGYRTAEVTLGGVDTREMSSKTMESAKSKGLYFIGEVVDVTGHLGGFNFQWAWSSGWCAGQYA